MGLGPGRGRPVPRRRSCPPPSISPVPTCAASPRGAAPLRETSPLCWEEAGWPLAPLLGEGGAAAGE